MPAPTIITAGSSKCVALPNGQAARPLPISTWNEIRVGVRLRLNNTGANMVGATVFTFGLTSGNTNLFHDATTTHFYGISFSRDPVGWESNAYSVINNSIITNCTRIGTTTNGLGGPSIYLYVAHAANTFGMFFLDFKRVSSTQMTQRVFHGSVNAVTNVTREQFLVQMENAAPTWAGHTQTAYTANQPVNEGVNGTLDHLYAAWGRTNEPLFISDIAVVRLS